MAEYSEVIKQFKRMCKVGNCATTTGCPMYPSCNISQCRKIAFERPAEFETRVMEWAEEHPEPVYPTWAEWLAENGVFGPFKDIKTDFSEIEILYKMRDMMFKPIPADIAEKLGIQPKEGT